MPWIENSLRQDSNTTKSIIFLTVLVVQALTVTRQDQNKIRSYQCNVDACASRLLSKVAAANPKKARHAAPLTPTKNAQLLISAPCTDIPPILYPFPESFLNLRQPNKTMSLHGKFLSFSTRKGL